jgi:hypothetical protein
MEIITFQEEQELLAVTWQLGSSSVAERGPDDHLDRGRRR